MTSPLTDQVKAKYPELPSSWLDTLWLLLRCIMVGQTTNLARLKDYLPAIIDGPKAQRTKPQSHYKRLTRFFEPLVYSNTWMGYRLRQLLRELTLRIIGSDRRLRGRLGRELLLDGSKWRVKGGKLQFLTLAILVDGVALPIAFIDLQKMGHSSQNERISFFQSLSDYFDFEGMTLIADREYIGLRWFEALRSTFKMHYIVRLKKGIYHQQVDAQGGKSREEMIGKMRSIKLKKIISKRIEIGSVTCYYIIVRNPKAGLPKEDEFIFLLSSWHNRTASAAAYIHRWSIETTFRHLKSNGFELDKVHFPDPAKREFMFALLNVIFALCV